METLARLKTANAAMRDRDQPLDDELHELERRGRARARAARW